MFAIICKSSRKFLEEIQPILAQYSRVMGIYGIYVFRVYIKWVKRNIDLWKCQWNILKVTSNDGDRNINNFETLRATVR